PTHAVLNAATGVSAARLAYADPIGRIAVDHKPRLILTEHNPPATVTNLLRPKTVIFDEAVCVHDEAFDFTGL
ncbi:hypothetical protein, partial [Synoicihabitans lomoniglobus]|nr:hypothetical protein [Opitutaceae bacterium LMO-M01]